MKKALIFTVMLLAASVSWAKPLDFESTEYPIGVYAADPANDEIFKLLKSFGVNYVHTYAMGQNNEKSLAKANQFLNLAQKHGMKVMFNLRGRTWVKEKNGVELLRKRVKMFKDHPALGFWYLYDEPQEQQMPILRKLYQMLKEETPFVPVAICTPWRKQWKCFQEVSDVIMIDNYPVKNEKFPASPLQEMGNFITVATEQLEVPVISIPQIFNWRDFPKVVRDYDVSTMRYPTYEELRYWNFMSLAKGCRGIVYYSFWRALEGGENRQWVKDVFGKSTRETRDFINLVENVHKPIKLKRAADNNYEMAIWQNKKQNKEYLVLINNWPRERAITNRWMENHITDATLTPIGGTRTTNAKISRDRIRINEKVAPWEVFVWEVNRIMPDSK